MIIKPMVYLLTINAIFTMSINLIHGEEALIFHDNPKTVYALLTLPDGSQIRKELINDAYAFKINRNGYFVMRDGSLGNGAWYKGRIDSSFNITKQVLPSIPSNVSYSSIAISEDGKRVAWSPQSDARKSELTIEEHVGGEPKILRKISVDGLIETFSWSPDSDLLAYFWGPPEVVMKNGFSLMLLDMKSPEKPPVEIAPPSFVVGINPDRSIPPEWSPDGKHILFEARCTPARDTGRCIVSVDDRTIIPSLPGGIWNQDGRYIYRIESVGDDSLGEYMVIETDISSHKEKVYTDDILKIGTGLFGTSLSPSGGKIVYGNKNKEIFVYDIIKKATVSYGTSNDLLLIINGRQLFFWIFPKD